MRAHNMLVSGMVTLAFVMFSAAAQAAPADGDAAVAKARTEYEQAMKGHDVGLQNAMKIQLSVQISKAKAAKKDEVSNNATPGGKNNA